MTWLMQVAQKQGCVISRGQALQVLSTDALDWRLESGRWRTVHRAVYCVDQGPLTPLGEIWAAVLACGRGATASHGSAAWLWGLLDAPPAQPTIVIPADRRIAPPAGVHVRRSKLLHGSTHPSAAPRRTRLEHTVLDLAATARTLDDALALVAQAVQRRLTTPERLRDAASRHGRFHRRRDVLGVLDDVAAGAHTLLELRYLRDVERRHGLPTGRRQAREVVSVATVYRDVDYEDYGVLIELDGRLGHSRPQDIWRDMARDNAVTLGARATLRYGYPDVTGRPCEVAKQVGTLLIARGWTGPIRRCGATCMPA
ncbi:hypothetical protein [Motilibacter deserti]|uniref:AbiEi antitoxin of type IV toxin-antitoxin system n=1 Tax=Motilibacter deserti TaxID=2714956 RepID=A0ABX0GVE1_9ACTN|nr:hypothetical protein [Motilibacter deserti]NHC13695.1 hypothetical protein [Motilibacter deserti]